MRNGDLFLAAAEQPDYEEELPRKLSRKEKAEIRHEALGWKSTRALWLDSGKMCNCGRPISFEDAFYQGSCIDCLHELSRVEE